MNYKSIYPAIIFSLFIPTLLHAMNCQLSWDESPSIKIGMNLNNAWATGVKVNVKDINVFAFRNVYAMYSNLTREQKMLLLTNPQHFIDAQASLFVSHTHRSTDTAPDSFKMKAKIIKKSNVPLYLSLGSSQHIKQADNNRNYNVKQHLFLYQNNTPEFDIALSYNKKSADTLGLQLQGFIKNNENPYAALNFSVPIPSTSVGLMGKLLLKDNISVPQFSFYNSIKEKKLSFVSATLSNVLLGSALYIIHREIEFRFPDEEEIEAHKKQVITILDKAKESLDYEINKIRKNK